MEVKKLVKEMVESPTPPPLEESWARFEKKLKARGVFASQSRLAKSKNLLLVKLAAVAGIAILLAGAFSVLFPVKARAIGDKIVSSIESLIGNTQMNIMTEYKHHEPGEVPPPEGFQELTIEEERVVTLEEAKSASPELFPINWTVQS